MSQTYQSKKSISGNVLVFVLAAAAFVGVVAYFATGLVDSLTTQRVTSKNQIQSRILLNSILDYMITGIKSKWCFSATLAEEDCNWTHARSVERLLLTDVKIKTMQSWQPPLNVTTLPVDSEGKNFFEVTFRSSDITANHILYPILNNSGQAQIYSIRVRVSSFKKADFLGNNLIDVEVILNPDSGATKILGIKNQMATRARVGVFARELNVYSLLVANSLRLDMTAAEINGASAANGLSFKRGDAGIPSVPPSSTGPGVVFQSPVYVNGDLVLPPKSQNPTTQQFANVSFGAKVVLGGPSELDPALRGGRLMSGSTVFQPDSWGGLQNRFYSQLSTVRSLVGGLDQAYVRDHGLDYLSGLLTSSTVFDKSRETYCIERAAVTADPAKFLQTGALLARVDSMSGGQSALTVALTNHNRFQPIVRSGKNVIGTAKVSVPVYEWDKDSFTLSQNGVEVATHDLEFKKAVQTSVEIKLGRDNMLVPIKNDSGQKMNESSVSDALSVLSDKITTLEGGGTLSPSEQDELNRLKEVRTRLQGVAAARKLELTVDSIEKNNFTQPQQIRFGTKLSGSGTAGAPIQLDVNFYDLGTNSSGDPSVIGAGYPPSPVHVRKLSAAVALANQGNLSLDNLPSGESNSLGAWAYSPDLSVSPSLLPTSASLVSKLWLIDQNVGDYDSFCEPNSSTSAFGVAGWTTKYRDQTRTSWKFHPVNTGADISDANLGSITFASAVEGFHVVSVAKKCTVRSTVSLLSGFLTCDKFEIEARSTPLTIIGTLILGGVIQGGIESSLVIDPSALQHGVTFRSIYHPDSLNDLRGAGVLKPSYQATTCNQIFLFSNSGTIEPFWHPAVNLYRASDTYSCMPVSLREKAQPFTWTQVDPDCGLDNTSATRKCKKHEAMIDVVEISRELEI